VCATAVPTSTKYGNRSTKFVATRFARNGWMLDLPGAAEIQYTPMYVIPVALETAVTQLHVLYTVSCG